LGIAIFISKAPFATASFKKGGWGYFESGPNFGDYGTCYIHILNTILLHANSPLTLTHGMLH